MNLNTADSVIIGARNKVLQLLPSLTFSPRAHLAITNHLDDIALLHPAITAGFLLFLLL